MTSTGTSQGSSGSASTTSESPTKVATTASGRRCTSARSYHPPPVPSLKPRCVTSKADTHTSEADATASGPRSSPGCRMPRHPGTSDPLPAYQPQPGVRRPVSTGSSTRTPPPARASINAHVSGSGATDA